MRSWPRPLLTACLLFLGHVAAAAEAPPADSLVQGLGSPEFSRREAAQAALLDRGPLPDVLAALHTAAASGDAEIRQRAAAILAQLTRYAEGDKLLTRRTVALDFDKVPLDKALATLAKQTGANLQLAAGKVADPARPVTVTTGELPAWEAVEAFRRAAGLVELFREDAPPPDAAAAPAYPGIRRSYYGGTVTPPATANLVPVVWADAPAGRPADGPAADRSGPVRVTAMPARFPQNRVIRGAGHVLIHLDIAPPADLRWERTREVRLTRAEDETTRPVTVAYAQPSPVLTDESGLLFGGFAFGGYYDPGAPGDRGNPRLAPLTLKTDDRLVHRLRVLEGVVLGTVSLPNQPVFSIDDLAKGVGTALDGPNDTRLTLQAFEALKTGDVKLRIAVEGPNPWAQARLGNRAAPVSLWDDGGLGHAGLKNYRFTDAAGKPVTLQTTSTSSSDNGIRQTSTLELQFRPTMTKKSPPVRLVVVGDRPVTVAVPFKLRDVPLP